MLFVYIHISSKNHIVCGQAVTCSRDCFQIILKCCYIISKDYIEL